MEQQVAPQGGALVMFQGQVRGGKDLLALELEHYPGMTERCIADIVANACHRWRLLQVRVLHRVGRLMAGERIVLVAVAAAHRQEAFAAAQYIMDYLKTRATFWKKEIGASATRWLEQRESDVRARENWDSLESASATGGEPI